MSNLDFGYASANAEAHNVFSKSGRSSTGAYYQGCLALSSGQAAGGVLIVLLSYAFLFDYLMLMGVILGAILFAAGAIGVLANLKKSRELLNVHIAVAMLGIVMSSQFIGQVWRDVAIDCAFAELFLKTNALEDLTKDVANHEMFSSVHNRMSELEDMVELLHMGVTDTVGYLKNNPTGDPNQDEREYVDMQLAIVREHAEQLIKEFEQDPDTSKESVQKWKPEDRARLQQKVGTAKFILERLEKHAVGDRDHQMTAADYEQVLSGLIRAMQTPSKPGESPKDGPEELKELEQELHDTKGALERIQNEVHILDEIDEVTREAGEESKKTRDKYAEEFMEMLKESHKRGEENIGAFALENMPEHCMSESKGIHYLGVLGILTSAMQLCTIYLALSISFRIPIKAE